MYFSTLLTLAAAVPATLAFPWHHQAASSSDSKRATTSYAASDATLYAYGTNISGWPLFYGANDGLVYLSPSANATAGLHNVTWDIPSMSDTDSASTAAKLTNGSTAGYLWLDVANGAFDNVQVLPANANHTGVTTGITVFGKQVVVSFCLCFVCVCGHQRLNRYA